MNADDTRQSPSFFPPFISFIMLYVIPASLLLNAFSFYFFISLVFSMSLRRGKQLYDKISCRAIASHRLATSDAVNRYRQATDVLRELPRTIRDGQDVTELRDILSNPFLKVRDTFKGQCIMLQDHYRLKPSWTLRVKR